MKPRRGAALMLVLWLVVLLGVIGGRVVSGTRTSAAIAANMHGGLVARYAAESGIEATVAAIEDTLLMTGESPARREWLNSFPANTMSGDSVALGDGRFAVVVVDVSARLDVNAASEQSLRTFFSRFTDLTAAGDIARAIRSYIERGGARPGEGRLEPDPSGGLVAVSPIRSLDELRDRRLVPERVVERAAPYLTVDGDGTINRVTASDTVLAAAGGELRDEPSRLLLISRGWMSGHALTHEIQAVYAINGHELVPVQWRERTR